jgi:hypothetical protein
MARQKEYSPMSWSSMTCELAALGDRPVAHVAHDLGMHPERLRKKVRQAEADSVKHTDLPST